MYKDGDFIKIPKKIGKRKIKLPISLNYNTVYRVSSVYLPSGIVIVESNGKYHTINIMDVEAHNRKEIIKNILDE